MHEILMGKKSKRPIVGDPNGYIFFADFTNEALGSKKFVDLSPNHIQVPTIGNPSAGFGVVDTADMGRCFYFDSSAYFFSGSSPLGNWTVGSYDLEIGYKKVNTALQILVATGNWGSYIDSGNAFSLDQYADSFQIFRMNAASTSYTRYFAPGPNTHLFTEILVQKRKAGTTITNLTTGASATGADFSIPADTYFGIGAARGGDGLLTGWIKYLRIKKVVE